MDKSDYWNKHYKASAVDDGCAEVTVHKASSTDWCSVEMVVNGKTSDRITFRSQEHAEQLHFLLGQMLGRND